jgi:lipid II:glycine glycyltransferase (peptidoglycan interpeptide bridge formation enzyme)
MSTLGRLADALPKAELFRQNFHHSLPTALPFAQRGFDLTLGYTYVLSNLGIEDEIWQTISRSRRIDIRKAQQRLEVRATDDLDLFLRLNHMTFARQGLSPGYSDDYVRRIDDACKANDARCILVAVDETDNAHGAYYLVHDQETTNGLMSGVDPNHRNSGAGSLLMWESLRFACEHSRTFNFSGGTMKGAEPFISSFGGVQTPYITVTRDSLRWRSLLLARDSARKLGSTAARLRAGRVSAPP